MGNVEVRVRRRAKVPHNATASAMQTLLEATGVPGQARHPTAQHRTLMHTTD